MCRVCHGLGLGGLDLGLGLGGSAAFSLALTLNLALCVFLTCFMKTDGMKSGPVLLTEIVFH